MPPDQIFRVRPPRRQRLGCFGKSAPIDVIFGCKKSDEGSVVIFPVPEKFILIRKFFKIKHLFTSQYSAINNRAQNLFSGSKVRTSPCTPNFVRIFAGYSTSQFFTFFGRRTETVFLLSRFHKAM